MGKLLDRHRAIENLRAGLCEFEILAEPLKQLCAEQFLHAPKAAGDGGLVGLHDPGGALEIAAANDR
ncbi:MAG: hypothetical protein IPL62_17170 [Caulobacteraceae bacterium]|nr:hypothetical protein [Caulobacteraceae bacterium]